MGSKLGGWVNHLSATFKRLIRVVTCLLLLFAACQCPAVSCSSPQCFVCVFPQITGTVAKGVASRKKKQIGSIFVAFTTQFWLMCHYSCILCFQLVFTLLTRLLSAAVGFQTSLQWLLPLSCLWPLLYGYNADQFVEPNEISSMKVSG